MKNLEVIVIIVSCLVSVGSIWAIVYFGLRIVEHHYIKKTLGDMPSSEEIHELYEKNNSIIRYENHSPTDENLRS